MIQIPFLAWAIIQLSMKIVVIGLGYVGVPVAAALADVGNKVVGNLSVPIGREEMDCFVEAWEGFLRKVQ